MRSSRTVEISVVTENLFFEADDPSSRSFNVVLNPTLWTYQRCLERAHSYARCQGLGGTGSLNYNRNRKGHYEEPFSVDAVPTGSAKTLLAASEKKSQSLVEKRQQEIQNRLLTSDQAVTHLEQQRPVRSNGTLLAPPKSPKPPLSPGGGGAGNASLSPESRELSIRSESLLSHNGEVDQQNAFVPAMKFWNKATKDSWSRNGDLSMVLVALAVEDILKQLLQLSTVVGSPPLLLGDLLTSSTGKYHAPLWEATTAEHPAGKGFSFTTSEESCSEGVTTRGGGTSTPSFRSSLKVSPPIEDVREGPCRRPSRKLSGTLPCAIAHMTILVAAPSSISHSDSPPAPFTPLKSINQVVSGCTIKLIASPADSFSLGRTNGPTGGNASLATGSPSSSLLFDDAADQQTSDIVAAPPHEYDPKRKRLSMDDLPPFRRNSFCRSSSPLASSASESPRLQEQQISLAARRLGRSVSPLAGSNTGLLDQRALSVASATSTPRSTRSNTSSKWSKTRSPLTSNATFLVRMTVNEDYHRRPVGPRTALDKTKLFADSKGFKASRGGGSSPQLKRKSSSSSPSNSNPLGNVRISGLKSQRSTGSGKQHRRAPPDATAVRKNKKESAREWYNRMKRRSSAQVIGVPPAGEVPLLHHPAAPAAVLSAEHHHRVLSLDSESTFSCATDTADLLSVTSGVSLTPQESNLSHRHDDDDDEKSLTGTEDLGTSMLKTATDGRSDDDYSEFVLAGEGDVVDDDASDAVSFNVLSSYVGGTPDDSPMTSDDDGTADPMTFQLQSEEIADDSEYDDDDGDVTFDDVSAGDVDTDMGSGEDDDLTFNLGEEESEGISPIPVNPSRALALNRARPGISGIQKSSSSTRTTAARTTKVVPSKEGEEEGEVLSSSSSSFTLSPGVAHLAMDSRAENDQDDSAALDLALSAMSEEGLGATPFVTSSSTLPAASSHVTVTVGDGFHVPYEPSLSAPGYSAAMPSYSSSPVPSAPTTRSLRTPATLAQTTSPAPVSPKVYSRDAGAGLAQVGPKSGGGSLVHVTINTNDGVVSTTQELREDEEQILTVSGLRVSISTERKASSSSINRNRGGRTAAALVSSIDRDEVRDFEQTLPVPLVWMKNIAQMGSLLLNLAGPEECRQSRLPFLCRILLEADSENLV